MSRTIFDKRILSEISDYPDSDTTNIINVLSTQQSSASIVFWTEFMMEESKHVGAEEDKLENGAKYQVELLGNCGLSRN